MPIVNFKSVREVSSEDRIHAAENLLKQKPGKKWKTKQAGEKSAFVILELEEPQEIVGIDIGNEHSAFVEVLVSNAGCAPDDFTEILIMCSFMTPIESRNSENVNRVRCFSLETLVTSASIGKWRMVKVICTQPFNKHVQYGLSFLNIHTSNSVPAKQNLQPKNLVPDKFLKQTLSSDFTDNSNANHSIFTLGKYTLREDSPDSESESTTALFKRWKNNRNNSFTAAAAIRQASKPEALRRLSEDPVKPKPISVTASLPSSEPLKYYDEQEQLIPVLDRNRDQLLFGNDDEAENQLLVKQIELDRERLRLENKTHTKTNRKSIEIKASENEKSKSSASLETKVSVRHEDKDLTKQNKKRPSSPSCRPSKKTKQTQYRPFNQLLRGVVLTISGIQNPDRANLRNKAISLGAKYKTDWELGCTHLICAFKNTPKYNQVSGKGKIVTRSWIDRCYSLKKYLPWRRYALDSKELAMPESDEEILDELQNFDRVDKQQLKSQDEKNLTLAMNDVGVTNKYSAIEGHNVISDSGSDTEDEIERVKIKNSSPNSNKANVTNATNKKANRDIYDVTTDEEDFLDNKLKLRTKSSAIL